MAFHVRIYVTAQDGRARRRMEGGWTTLVDGTAKSLDHFNRIGDANWRVEDGAVVPDKGKGGRFSTTKLWPSFCDKRWPRIRAERRRGEQDNHERADELAHRFSFWVSLSHMSLLPKP